MPTPPARTRHPPLIRTKIVEYLAPVITLAQMNPLPSALGADDALTLLDLILACNMAVHAHSAAIDTISAVLYRTDSYS